MTNLSAPLYILLARGATNGIGTVQLVTVISVLCVLFPVGSTQRELVPMLQLLTFMVIG